MGLRGREEGKEMGERKMEIKADGWNLAGSEQSRSMYSFLGSL